MHALSLAQVLEISGCLPSTFHPHSPVGHGLEQGFVQGMGLVGCNNNAALLRFSSRPAAHQAQQHKDNEEDPQVGIKQGLLYGCPRQLRPPRHLRNDVCASQCACLLIRHCVHANSWQCVATCWCLPTWRGAAECFWPTVVSKVTSNVTSTCVVHADKSSLLMTTTDELEDFQVIWYWMSYIHRPWWFWMPQPCVQGPSLC